MAVVVYSKSMCPFCVQAKDYLKKNSVFFTEVNLDDEEKRKEFYEKCGPSVRTMPQIFLDDERIGGYKDLINSDLVARVQAGNFGESF